HLLDNSRLDFDNWLAGIPYSGANTATHSVPTSATYAMSLISSLVCSEKKVDSPFNRSVILFFNSVLPCRSSFSIFDLFFRKLFAPFLVFFTFSANLSGLSESDTTAAIQNGS